MASGEPSISQRADIDTLEWRCAGLRSELTAFEGRFEELLSEMVAELHAWSRRGCAAATTTAQEEDDDDGMTIGEVADSEPDTPGGMLLMVPREQDPLMTDDLICAKKEDSTASTAPGELPYSSIVHSYYLHVKGPHLPPTIAPAGRSQDVIVEPKLHIRLREAVQSIKRSGDWSRAGTASLGMKARFAKRGGRGPRKPCIGVMHPYSTFRVIWDLLALFLLAYDAFVLPISVAWAYDFNHLGMKLMAVGYWALDVVLNFNKGFYDKSVYFNSRKKIARHYITTWFFADVMFVAIDIVFLFTDEEQASRASNIRPFMRILKVARLVRIVKSLKVGLMIRNYCKQKGLTGIWMIWDLAEMLLAFLLIGHWLCCCWYFMGRMAKEADWSSWLDDPRVSTAIGSIQYLFAFHWVLSAIVLSPIEPEPHNNMEQFFSLLCTIAAIFVLGAVISKIGLTIDTIVSQEGGRYGKLWELGEFLATRAVPADLSHRITHYTDNLLREQAMSVRSEPEALQALPTDLRMEVYVRIRGELLQQHPFWSLIAQDDHRAFAVVCTQAITARDCHRRESVFTRGTRATCMVILVDGHFLLEGESGSWGHRVDKDSDSVTVYTSPECLAEAALYTSYAHGCSLLSQEVGSVLELTSDAVLDALEGVSPRCIAAFCDYGQELLRITYSEAKGTFYQGATEIDDILPHEVLHSAVMGTTLAELKVLQMAQDSHDHHVTPWRELQQALFHDVCLQDTSPHDFLHRTMTEDLSTEEVQSQLHEYFPELSRENGTYSRLGLLDERDRVATSMHCVIWMLRNDYSSFVAGQPKDVLLRRGTWQELRNILHDAIRPMGVNAVQILMTFLAVRGIGKSEISGRLCPPSARRTPESIVTALFDELPAAVPSVATLGDSVRYVKALFRIHEKFNFAHFTQGESVPQAVSLLQKECDAGGTGNVRLYLGALLGLMSGLQGSTDKNGSEFMTEQNGTSIVLAVKVLNESLQSRGKPRTDPVDVYWKYQCSRAQEIGLSTNSPEELVFARLVCLSRVQSMSDTAPLRTAWLELSSVDRNILITHFLASGIHDRALVFTSLPNLLSVAAARPCVGLSRALTALADVVKAVHKRLAVTGGFEESVVFVSVQPLAEFASEVRSGHAFEQAARNSKLDQDVSGALHMTLQEETDDPLTIMAQEIAAMRRVQDLCMDTLATLAPRRSKR